MRRASWPQPGQVVSNASWYRAITLSHRAAPLTWPERWEWMPLQASTLTSHPSPSATGAKSSSWRATPWLWPVGERGPVYDRGLSPRDAELANLRRHLALSMETGKPAILHCRSKPGQRDAQDDL